MPSAFADFQFSTGQNEGTERAFLATPQLASLVNARVQKPGRIVKRSGCTGFSLNVGAPLVVPGPGADTTISGSMRAVLPSGIVVDEQLYLYDSKNPWKKPDTVTYAVNGSQAVIGVASTVAHGQMPEFVPDGSFIASRRDSTADSPGSVTPSCDSASAMGYVFFAYVVYAPNFAAGPISLSFIRVVAFDPSTGVQAFVQDVASAGAGSLSCPRLMVIGTKLILCCVDSTGLALALGMSFASGPDVAFASGFNSRNTFAISSVTAGLDAAPLANDATQFLMVYQTAAAQLTTALINTATLGLVSSANTATSNGVMRAAIIGTAGENIYLAWHDSTANNVLARVFSASAPWTVTGATITVCGDGFSLQRPQLARQSATACMIVMGGLTSNPRMVINSVTSAGVVTGGAGVVQNGLRSLSRIVQIGAKYYIWGLNDFYGSQQRFAYLVRIAPVTSSTGPAFAAVTFPIEAAITEEIVAASPALTNEGAWPTMCSTGSGYFLPLAVSLDQPSANLAGVEIRAFKLRHMTESVRQRVLGFSRRGNISFVPSARPTEVDGIGSRESGFHFAPTINAAAQATIAGTHLTATSLYSWTVVLFWRDANGDVCRSAPSTPLSVTLGGTNNQVTLTISNVDVGSRGQVEGRVYRTQANGGVFQYVGSVDLRPTAAYGLPLTQGTSTFVDNFADTSIAGNEIVYNQVGGELPNSPVPACRFSVVGGSRVWIGGLFNARTVQASKQFRPGVGIEFCDDDAFRATLPETITGLAWMDALVVFTRSGIYTISGEGPGVDGNGSFQEPVRLPYPEGCVDWRSILVTSEGVWFQSTRGLRLLPRGFGEPVAAGEPAMDTLATYPVIAAAELVESALPQEKTARWYCADSDTPGAGAAIVFDLVHKAWSVDKRKLNSGLTAAVVAAGYIDSLAGIITMLESTVGYPNDAVIAQEATGSLLDTVGDNGFAIDFSLSTGDLRVFGMMGNGPIQRVGALMSGAVAGGSSISLTKATARGSATSVLPLAAQNGYQYFWASLGATEGRENNALVLTISESSVNTGYCAFHGIVLETGANQGGMLLSSANQVT